MPMTGYLMARTTLSPDVGDNDVGLHAKSCRSSHQNEAKADDPHQTHM
jgi:hypothetical protein